MANLAYMFIPVANGRVDATNPCTLTIDNDTNTNKYVAQFAHGSTNILHFASYMPANYLSGSGTLRLRWRCPTSTSGNVYWNVYYTYNANNASTTSSAGSAVTATTTVAGTMGDTVESTFTLSSLTASVVLDVTVERVGGNVADTCTVLVELLDLSVEYTCDPTQQQSYIWVPAQAFAIPAASGAVLSNVELATQCFPFSLNFRHGYSDYADVDICLPSSYNGNLLASTAWVPVAGSGNFTWRLDMATTSPGSASDPALTTGTQWTFTGNSGTNMDIDSKRAVAVSPSASNTVNCRLWRLGSDSGDTSTQVAQLVGMLLTFNVTTRNPAWVIADPLVSAQSTSTTQKDDDTNTSKWVTVLATGVNSSCDFIARTPSTYAAGGQLRVRWRCANASTNTAYLRADFGYAALGYLGDPTLTTGTAITVANGGSSIVNETLFAVSTGAAASDELLFRINRLGASGSDMLAYNIEILDVRFEYNLS